MNANAEASSSALDTLKLLVAVALLVAGIVGFYWFEGHSNLLRVIGLLAAAVVAGFVAVQTEKGRAIWSFFGESRTEVRKVVWPTRQDAMQTTLIVLLVVILMSLFMWGVDAILFSIVKSLTGHGG